MDDNKKIEKPQKAIGFLADNIDVDIIDVICYIKGWLPMQQNEEITISSPDKKKQYQIKRIK